MIKKRSATMTDCRAATDELVLNNDNHFIVLGNIRVKIGNTLVAVAQAGGRTYLSVTTKVPKPAVLGFAGLQNIFNFEGASALALLEANGLQREQYSEFVKEYEVE